MHEQSHARQAGGVEPSDVRLGAIIRVAAMVAATVCVVAAVCWALLELWQPGRPAASFAFAAPRLQPAPQDERTAYFAEKRRLLDSYAWVDRDAGTARIPIDAAMDLLASRAGGGAVQGRPRKAPR